jgi:FkbM family methyltransferase
MYSKIMFHLTRVSVWLEVWGRKISGQTWKEIEGVYLPVSSSLGFSVLRWILNGKYEDGEIRIVKKYLEKGDNVLEIGTGLGFISSYCSKIAGGEHVYTYEANPLNLLVAKQVFAKNKVHPTVTNAFLGTDTGTVSFPIDKANRLASSLFKEHGEQALIPTIQLNEEIKRIRPSFLIMDIEGGEYDIFHIIDFQSIRKIQFELHPQILSEEKCMKIFSLLERNGFRKEASVSDDRNFYYYR